MKSYCLLISVATCILLNAQTYQNTLPETINGDGTINVTADCKYAPNGAGVKEDCYVGLFNDGGYQNFSHKGDGTLLIQASLPADKTNKDIIFGLHTLSTANSSGLYLRGFHGLSASNINLSNGSLLIVELADKKGSSAYGDMPVFLLRDDPYGQNVSKLIKSRLEVYNGNIILGKTQLYIDQSSTIMARKGDNSTNSAGTSNTNPTIMNQGHIVNYGYVIAQTVKNGESITTTGGTPPPGIGNQNISGIIDNYGLIDATDVDNAADGTINFHSFNGEMGSIKGKLTNNNGKINIYVAGAKYGQHNLVDSGSSGLDSINIIFENGSSEFISANMDTSKEKIIISKKEDSISTFRQSFNGSKRGILDVLDSRYNIYTYGGANLVRKVVDDTQQGVQSGYLSAPLTMLESMKPKFNTLTTDLNLSLIGNGFFGSDVGAGWLGGLNMNYGMETGRYTAQYQLAYGYGGISSDRENYSTDLKAHIISFGAMNRLMVFNDKFELDSALYSLVGIFNSLQNIKMANLSTETSMSKGSFNIFNLGADIHLGYRTNFDNFSIKPFVGFNQVLSIRNKFTEKGGLNAVMPSINSYMMYLATGLESRYLFRNNQYLYTKLGYEYRLINSKDLVVNLGNTNVIFATPFTNKLAIDVGGEFLIGSTSLLTLGISYNNAITESIHYLAGNVAYKVKF